jgi:hypothetical protein
MKDCGLIEIEETSELGYWHQRAEEELALARSSNCPEAERFRFTLAGLYFDRYYSAQACR